MVNYKNFQFSYLITLIFLMIMIFISFSYLYQWGTNPISEDGFIFLLIFFSLIMLNFYGMTTIITDREIFLKFGAGLIKKKISLSQIESAEITTYPIWYGYGIRFTPRGWLYNVSGRQAVEIKIRNKKTRILIGTNEKELLLTAVKAGISE